ncbi:MAG: hypothetical protein WA056_13415 [Gallionella sp.]
MNQSTGQIAIYQADDGHVQLGATLERERVWLTQWQSVRVLSGNS